MFGKLLLLLMFVTTSVFADTYYHPYNYRNDISVDFMSVENSTDMKCTGRNHAYKHYIGLNWDIQYMNFFLQNTGYLFNGKDQNEAGIRARTGLNLNTWLDAHVIHNSSQILPKENGTKFESTTMYGIRIKF